MRQDSERYLDERYRDVLVRWTGSPLTHVCGYVNSLPQDLCYIYSLPQGISLISVDRMDLETGNYVLHQKLLFGWDPPIIFGKTTNPLFYRAQEINEKFWGETVCGLESCTTLASHLRVTKSASFCEENVNSEILRPLSSIQLPEALQSTVV